MRTLTLTIFLMTNAIIGQGQNLVSNSSFENGTMQLNCQNWYDGCGNELTSSCDTIQSCWVNFFQDSPSDIPEEKWCLQLHAGYQEGGFAETYVTGQSGTIVYQLELWMKTNSQYSAGIASIGVGTQSQYSTNRLIFDTAVNWKEVVLIDTLAVQLSDTVSVRLSTSPFVDPPLSSTAFFDLIELTIIDTLSSINNQTSFDHGEIKIYPNPSKENITFEIGDRKNYNHTLTIYNATGRLIKKIETKKNIINVDIEGNPNGLYFYQILSRFDKDEIKRGKFIKL